MIDNQTFRKLMETYKDRVVNTCFGFLHNREDAEDVAQEVFIEVYLSYHTFRGEADIASWIYRIAINKSLDVYRKRNSKKGLAFFANLLRLDQFKILKTAHNEEDAQVKMEQNERMQLLYQALDNIPVNQRIAITLSKFEDLSQKEIAAVMDVSESAVESLLSRAKLSLRKKLENYYKNNT